MNENIFQEEVILPSKGLAYPEGFVPDGKVVISMMGTQEEKILAGGRVSFNVLVTQLLDRLIVHPKISSANLLTLDRMFLLLKIRIHSLGPAYSFQMKCPNCDEKSEYKVNLAEQDVNYFPDDWEEPFSVTLPVLEDEIKLRLLRSFDESEVENFVKKIKSRNPQWAKEGDPSYIPLMAKAIVSTPTVTEASNFQDKIEYVQALKTRDSLAIQHKMEEMDFGIDMKKDLECPNCGAEIPEVTIPLNEEFFRPKLSK